jgi:hypothetical protein
MLPVIVAPLHVYCYKQCLSVQCTAFLVYTKCRDLYLCCIPFLSNHVKNLLVMGTSSTSTSVTIPTLNLVYSLYLTFLSDALILTVQQQEKRMQIGALPRYTEIFHSIAKLVEYFAPLFSTYAKMGYDKYGRGYIAFPNYTYLQMINDKFLHVYYTANINLPFVNSYDPDNEFVITFMCSSPGKEAFIMTPTIIKNQYEKNHKSHSLRQSILSNDFVTSAWTFNITNKSNIPSPLNLPYTRIVFHAFANVNTTQEELDKKRLSNVKEGLSTILNRIEYSCDCCKKELHRKALKKCSACKMAVYCDKECQTKDWKKHKQQCKQWQKCYTIKRA